MIRLAANLSFLFTEYPFLERFAAAADAGFRAVEWNFAYDVPTGELAARLRDNGLKLVLVNTPQGDARAGELGLAVLPGREADAEAAFDMALKQAVELGASTIHYLAGRPAVGQSPDVSDALFLRNMRRAADKAAAAGITIALEPLNPRDRPGYHLSSVAHAVRLIEAAQHANIGLQLDLYHCQIMGGDLIRTIEHHIGRIVHVQIAGVPNRDEPSAGEVAYQIVLDRLDALGYTGYVGCEYHPAGSTRDGLGWAVPYLRTE